MTIDLNKLPSADEVTAFDQATEIVEQEAKIIDQHKQIQEQTNEILKRFF
jgi:hypothetical protein